jgi:murein DD-endopeptidase MepM/ murein hydrolase activator NlpD
MNARTQRLIARLGLAAALCVPASQAASQPTAADMIEHMDADGDGRISKDEFRGRRRPFSDFDRDGDGYATRAEIETVFGTGRDTNADGAAGRQGSQGTPSARFGRATLRELDTVTRGAFLAKRVRAHEISRGLIESRLIPVYPADASCPQVDHIFGERWQGQVHRLKSNATRHHGADIPAPRGTPILAMADGVVIAKSTGEGGDFRGVQITLRHTPEDIGLPVWLYTTYAHFSEMPEVRIGQHVRMGDPLGPTGKTGVPSQRRGDHLHVEVLYSTNERYVETRHGIVPVNGHYADVVTLMRARMPLDTNVMRALPDAERHVAIPHKLDSGSTVPTDALIIWPYACTED